MVLLEFGFEGNAGGIPGILLLEAKRIQVPQFIFSNVFLCPLVNCSRENTEYNKGKDQNFAVMNPVRSLYQTLY